SPNLSSHIHYTYKELLSQPEFPLHPARTDEPAQPNPSSFHTARTAPTFLNSPKKIRPLVARRGPRARNNISIATPPPGVGRRAPPRPTVERRVYCSPVVFNDIKHLTATCDRRARFRHPVTARGLSHAQLPGRYPESALPSMYAMISMA